MSDLPQAGGRYKVAVALLAVAVLGWSASRAAVLDLTHDEAITFLRFVGGGPRAIYDVDRYDANNHVLYSLLAWVSTSMFGPNELALRLPAVLAGALVVGGTGRFFRLLAGPTPLAFAGVLVVVLNPLVMDFLVAARGYGLGLGLSLWAWGNLILALRGDRLKTCPHDKWALLSAGIAQGLAVGANLVFVYPNAALALVFLALTLNQNRGQLSRTAKRLAICYILPGAVTAVAVSLPIFRHLGGEHFYYGTESLFETAVSIVGPSLNPVAERGWFGTPGPFPVRLVRPLTVTILIVLSLNLILGWLTVSYRKPVSDVGRDDLTATAGLVYGGSVVLLSLLVLIREITGMPYPQDRTGIYFIPLAVGCLIRRPKWRSPVGIVGTVFLALLAIHFAAQVQAEFLHQWRYDAGTGRVYRFLDDRAAKQPGLTVGHDWRFEPTLNYYNWRADPPRFPPFDRSGPDGDYDLYYLEAETWEKWRPRGEYRVVYTDPVSKAVVVERVGK